MVQFVPCFSACGCRAEVREITEGKLEIQIDLCNVHLDKVVAELKKAKHFTLVLPPESEKLIRSFARAGMLNKFNPFDPAPFGQFWKLSYIWQQKGNITLEWAAFGDPVWRDPS